MTPADKLQRALADLDEARRGLEDLASSNTGDEEIDGAVSDTVDAIDSMIGLLAVYERQCVTDQPDVPSGA